MSEQVIPNAVGRLDPVTEALAQGRFSDAGELLIAERDRLLEKWDAEREAAKKTRRKAEEVAGFILRLSNSAEFRETARVACGGAK